MTTSNALAREKPLELRFTVAVGAAVFIQSALAFVWAGAAAERIAQLERRAGVNEELIVRTARLEEQVDAARIALARIERKLDDAMMDVKSEEGRP